MDTILETQSSPVAISNGFITTRETRIVMQCHDRIFKSVTILDGAGDVLFTGESKGLASYSWRRTIKDASGTPVFDVRRSKAYPLKNEWIVQTPGNREVCTVHHGSWSQRQVLDAVVRNEEDSGKEVKIELRPKDQGALTMDLVIRGAPVAEIQMAEVNANFISNGSDRSVWKARIAGGVDIALVVAIIFCRAELQHSWKE